MIEPSTVDGMDAALDATLGKLRVHYRGKGKICEEGKCDGKEHGPGQADCARALPQCMLPPSTLSTCPRGVVVFPRMAVCEEIELWTDGHRSGAVVPCGDRAGDVVHSTHA